jgi:hypothetical protein
VAVARDIRQDYLHLLARAVSNYLYLGGSLDESAYPIRTQLYDGERWRIPDTARPHTGVRLVQLLNLQQRAFDVLKKGVPGDFLEAGVWQGGVVVFLAGVLRAYDAAGVRLWAADTFAGIPRDEQAGAVEDSVDAWTDRWAVPLEHVRENIRRYGLLDDRIRFVSGPFREALPRAGIEKLALVRIDADAYASTLDALTFLHPRVATGGCVIVDDWHLEGCRRAVLEYRAKHVIRAPIQGVYDRHAHDDDPFEVFWTV